MGPVTANDRRIVMGKGVAYTLQSYDREGNRSAAWGRDLGPRYMSAAEIDRVFGRTGSGGEKLPATEDARRAQAQVPDRHFHNIRFDGSGRLWALGRDTTNNFFADVFADTSFLGRIALPCAHAAEPYFSGEWMLVNCSASFRDPPMLQLFRFTQ